MTFCLTFATGIAVGVALHSGAAARAVEVVWRCLDWLDRHLVLDDPDVQAARMAPHHVSVTSTTRPTVFTIDADGDRQPVEPTWTRVAVIRGDHR